MSLNLTGANLALGVGSVVLGKFRIDRTIAEGGMGLVVAATHLQLEQTVALKFFRGDLGGQGEPLMRFMREAKAAAQLRSEHVARVLDVGVTEDGTPFMVMEYLEGQSLDNVLAARGPVDISNATEYAIQACEGLAEAHARGIVHRDIKPSNLFLVERSPGWGTIKILDFGISKVSLAQASNITTNLNMGTPCYMSPEQLRSTATVDQRTDIWSLGSTLYELLAGKAPFDPSLPLLSLALEIVTKQPPALRELRPEIPEELAAIVARCMAKDREERFDSAASLAMALIPFTGQRARVPAERAVSITPAIGVSALRGNAGGNPGHAGHTGIDQGTPPPVKTPTAELWKIKGDGFSGGATPAPALAEDTVRLVTEDIVQPFGPAFPFPSAIPPTAIQANPLKTRRQWSRRQLATGVSGFVLFCAVIVLALLTGRRQPPPHVGVIATQSRPTPPPQAPPPPLARPPEPPPLNDLVVRVSPPSAQVTIDGLAVTGNPFHGRYRNGETHQVRAFAAGYKPKGEQVSLAKDMVLDFSLEKDDRNEDSPSARRNPSAPHTTTRATTRTKMARHAPPPSEQPVVASPPPEIPAARSAAPSMAQDTVDPAGGKAPVHPIQTKSPYETP